MENIFFVQKDPLHFPFFYQIPLEVVEERSKRSYQQIEILSKNEGNLYFILENEFLTHFTRNI